VKEALPQGRRSPDRHQIHFLIMSTTRSMGIIRLQRGRQLSCEPLERGRRRGEFGNGGRTSKPGPPKASLGGRSVIQSHRADDICGRCLHSPEYQQDGLDASEPRKRCPACRGPPASMLELTCFSSSPHSPESGDIRMAGRLRIFAVPHGHRNGAASRTGLGGVARNATRHKIPYLRPRLEKHSRSLRLIRKKRLQGGFLGIKSNHEALKKDEGGERLSRRGKPLNRDFLLSVYPTTLNRGSREIRGYAKTFD